MEDLFLIRIFGDGGKSLTTRMSALLAEVEADILDIGQSVIHNNLSLAMLVYIPNQKTDALLKIEEKLATVSEKFVFARVSSERYEKWVEKQGAPRYVLTLLARKIRASHMAAVTELISTDNLKVDGIKRLSGRVSRNSVNTSSKACFEFSIRGKPTQKFRENLIAISSKSQVDIALQEDGIYRRHRRLVAFDMDSTLIAAEVIDELGDLAGVGAQVKKITARAMAGELDFSDSLRRRVSLLQGLSESSLEKVASMMPLTEGVEQLFKILNRLGYKTAIISGGFTFFGDKLKSRLGIDHVYANELEIKENCLTGQVLGPIIGAQQKSEILQQIAARENISLEQTIAVGDGANDLPMLSASGLGIAFNAKPMVRKAANQSISTLGLDSLLYLMGIRDHELNTFLS
ncbi:MAG: phosphoserine phosphatase SerB [Gammaproteobacteria bacterium]|nr:phosphoserine phosphatase SerB [Gammaproteobacteria bacterium]